MELGIKSKKKRPWSIIFPNNKGQVQLWSFKIVLKNNDRNRIQKQTQKTKQKQNTKQKQKQNTKQTQNQQPKNKKTNKQINLLNHKQQRNKQQNNT